MEIPYRKSPFCYLLTFGSISHISEIEVLEVPIMKPLDSVIMTYFIQQTADHLSRYYGISWSD